jgi:predicted enzyme related to lactoylglutathione lyase
MSSSHGKFVWYDLMTDDCKAAEAFYRSIVGWSATDAGMADSSYTLLSAGPTMVGGLMPIPEDARAAGARPRWTGYIAVDDVDAYAARVKAAGGAIHRPGADIPGVGRFAVAADPHGAIFILFKGMSDQQPAPAIPDKPGYICWRELHAGNGAEAFAFYSGLFGWTKTEGFDMGPMGTYQTFATGGPRCGGMMTKMALTHAPFWLYYFSVDAIDDAAAKVKAGGGEIINGPMQVPDGGWIVQCLDPQGAMFALASHVH